MRCLMRPRPGDFLYTEDELALLCAQMPVLRTAGADGFVIGALTADGALDTAAMRRLISAAGPGAGLTLHRAIDVSRDPRATYRAAAALGLDTVLTSGAAAHCLQGEGVLRALLDERDRTGGPEVLIGAGGERGCNHRAVRPLARGPRVPHERQSGNGKRDAFPPPGRADGPARPGRMAHPADKRRCGPRGAPGAGRRGRTQDRIKKLRCFGPSWP